MNKVNRLIYIISLFLYISNSTSYNIENQFKEINKDKLEITTTFQLEPTEILYKDSLIVSTNNPGIKLTKPITENSDKSFFDPKFQETKYGYQNNTIFNYTATKTNDFNSEISPVVNYNYYINTDNQPMSGSFAINFKAQEINSNNYKKNIDNNKTKASSNFFQEISKKISEFVLKTKQLLSDMFSSTGSWWIRLLAALILGILLSLTPCLYPMIPITIGILQANKVKTTFESFLLALSYTIGVSITFAVLGLVAAASTTIFGELQGSPYFVIPLVILLAYLGLSMFGFYDMYIPRFLQTNNNFKGGSFVSSFMFGAVSGTVASPCLSPGLALILNYVTSISSGGALSSYIEGFLLLFVFGIGSSLPLLIIGTFSTAANVLPKAGLWMVEVKKLVGLMLILMCFYNLSNLSALISMPILLYGLATSLLIFGLYYFWTTEKYDSTKLKIYKNLIGLLLIISSVLTAYYGFRSSYNQEKIDGFWSHEYSYSIEKAKTDSKRLFIDIGASYCGACKELDKTIFQKSSVRAEISKNYIPVKIESDQDTNSYEQIKQKYGKDITGFPTYLIVDQNSGEIIKKWGSNLEDISIEQFLRELTQLKS